MSSYNKKYKKYRNYLKERLNLNELPSKRPPQTRKEALILEICNVCRGAHSDSL